jgi:hypothetical protein
VIRPRFSMAEWCVWILATSLYVASFFLPAIISGANFATDSKSPIVQQGPMLGHQAYAAAWSFSSASWWANPCAWLALVFCVVGRPRAAGVLATLGFAVALTAIGVGPISWRFGMLGVGYWTWAGSMALIAAYYADRWYRTFSNRKLFTATEN